MCGIVGFSCDTPKSEKVLKEMASRIIHRGPDDEGYYLDGDVAMGFRRLSIIDLGSGHQPMKNEDGSVVITFNGEIYNYRELRQELIEKGHVFKTKSDTETVVHAYEEYGSAMLARLRGMFAFVIYDKKKGKLFGARDIFGIKPFYYYRKGDCFMYASEIKAFLPHPRFEKELYLERLPDYLCFEYIPTAETMFKNVFKLPGGHYFEYENNILTIKEYNRISFNIDDSKPIEYWKDRIGGVFVDSCEAHMIADVEVGCFLSSGVDSSLVTNEMAKRGKVKAFSVGYEEEKYSELRHAKELAEKISVENYQNKISAADFFGVAGTVQYHMDEPLPNPSAVPLYFLAQNAAKHVKVVLSGEGADELFGGYIYYQECLDFERYQKLVPQSMRRAFAKLARRLPKFHGRRFLIRGQHSIETRYIRNNYVYTSEDRDGILANPIPAKPPEYYTKPVFDRVKGEDEITKMQLADIYTWLLYDILQKADKMSMASSLELRVPFLDKEMLKIAMQIPSKFRVGKHATKLALREYAAEQLPEKTANMIKLGFPVPLHDWLSQDLYYNMVKEVFLSDTAAEFFNRDAIIKLLDDHRDGRAANMKRIWSVYSFLLWYDEFFVKR